MENKSFLEEIQAAKTDLHVLALLMQLFDPEEMSVLVAALTRVQELILMQKELRQ